MADTKSKSPTPAGLPTRAPLRDPSQTSAGSNGSGRVQLLGFIERLRQDSMKGKVCQFKLHPLDRFANACGQDVYKSSKYCLRHFMQALKAEIRHILVKVYKHPQQAFGAFDPDGLGKLTMDAILNHQMIKNLKNQYSREDVRKWLVRDEVFDMR